MVQRTSKRASTGAVVVCNMPYTATEHLNFSLVSGNQDAINWWQQSLYIKHIAVRFYAYQKSDSEGHRISVADSICIIRFARGALFRGFIKSVLFTLALE